MSISLASTLIFVSSVPLLSFYDTSASLPVKRIIHETAGLTSPSLPSSSSPTTPFNATTPSTPIDPNQQQVDNITGSYSTYNDPILQISIQYPSDYEVKEVPGGVLFSSQSLEGLPSMNSPEFSLLETSLDVIDLSPEVNSAQKFMREMMNEQRKYDINILALNETTLSGNNTAYRTIYTTFDTSQAMDLFTVKDGTGYYLSFSVMPPGRFQDYTTVMQKMSESFQILG